MNSPAFLRRLALLLPCLLVTLSVPAASFSVTSTNDSGVGSLRQAVADAALSAGSDTISFATALDGATIVLASQITVGADDVTIDASGLDRGITLSGGGTVRILQANAGSTLFVQRVNFTRGNAGAANGGALLTSGAALLVDCNFSENNANRGGAIFANSSGALTVSQCSFFNNTATDSAALWAEGTSARVVSFTNSTVTQNRCAAGGTGAITVDGSATLSLVHCTVAANAGDSFGGGIYVSTTLTVDRCIIAANTATAAAAADIFNEGGTVVANGPSLIGSNQSVTAAFPAAPPLVGTSSAPVDPKLGALFFGGRLTPTLAPRSDSPAVDAATDSAISEDQRGYPRLVEGASDLGSVERGPILKITSNADAGTGTLREAVANAKEPDSRIRIDSTLAGTSIVLTSGELVVNGGRSLEVDGSAPGGIYTISGGGNARLFNISGGASLSLARVQLTGAMGGAVLAANSSVRAEDTAFSGNAGQTSAAGALAANACEVVLQRSLFSANTATAASAAGAIKQAGGGTMSLTNCTLSGNTASGATSAGGISGSSLNLIHCTVSGNTGTGQGGGLSVAGTLRLERSLVAGNLDASVSRDVCKLSGTVTAVGSNLIGSNGSGQTGSVATEFPAGTLVGTPGTPLNAQLGALADYGGPTQSLGLRTASPARESATGSLLRIDQRGFPRPVGVADLGAYEAGTLTSFGAWALETHGLNPNATLDSEGDGAGQLLEYALRRNPNATDANLSPTLTSSAGATKIFAFRYTNLARDLRYIIQRSNNLTGAWTEVARLDTSTGALTGSILPVVDSTAQTITLTDATGGPRDFWRLLVEKVP